MFGGGPYEPEDSLLEPESLPEGTSEPVYDVAGACLAGLARSGPGTTDSRRLRPQDGPRQASIRQRSPEQEPQFIRAGLPVFRSGKSPIRAQLGRQEERLEVMQSNPWLCQPV